MADQVRVKVSGEDTGVSALLRTLSKQLSTLDREQKRAATSTTQMAAAQRTASADARAWGAAQSAGSSAAAGLTRRLVALAAAYGGISTVLAGIRRGLDVNAELETSQLGIAALITAQAQLATANGRVLEGTEALNAAQGIAQGQLQALRLAGLQTTATFQQLARAFQTAVGPGLAAGLSLDQVRAVTVGLTQAASALGVPMEQLDQEVRSILAGEIDVNSRVAKTLGITNAQVKLERERGTLAAFLLERLQAFNVAGERAQSTFAGIRSNIKEAIDILAQDATGPLFQRLAAAGQAALARVFDLDTGKLAPAFDGIAALARDAFAGLGDLLARAITGAIDGAERLSRWVERNRDGIRQFAGDVADTVGALAAVVREAVKLGAAIVGAGVETGVLGGALRTARDAALAVAGAAGFIRDNLAAVTAILTGAALAAGIAKLATLGVFASGGISTALGLAGLAVVEAPLVATAAAIGTVVFAVNALEAAQERARVKALALDAALTKSAQEAPALVAEYRKLAEQIESGALKGNDLKKAQERIKGIKDDLIALSPRFRDALDGENTDLRAQASAAAQVAAELEKTRQAKVRDAKAELARLRQREVDLANAPPPSTDAQFVAQEAKLRNLRSEIAQTEAALRALGDEAAKPLTLPAVVVPTPPPTVKGKGTGTGTGPATGAKNDLKQITDATIQEQQRAFRAQKADLDRQLADNLVSWDRYFAELNVRAELSLNVQREALQRLLASTTDAGDRAKILEQQADLERQRTAIVAENAAQRAELERRLSAQVQDLEVQQLRAEGQTVEARRRELVASFADLRARLVLENKREAVTIIDSLIDVGVAHARIEQLETVFQQAAKARQDAEASVQARVAAGVLNEHDAREELLGVYQQQRDAIRAIIPALAAQAAATHDATDAETLRQYQMELEKVNLLIQQTGSEWAKVRTDLKEGIRGDLADFFGQGINQVHSLTEAVASLAQSVVGTVQRIMGELLATKIVDWLAGLFGLDMESSADKLSTSARELTKASVALASAAALALSASMAMATASGAATSAGLAPWLFSIPGFATGGYTGPGGRYEPAGIVHRGEYVIPAPVVRELGVDRLDLLAGLRTPSVRRIRRRTLPGDLPGYAGGGFVAPVAPQGSGATGGGTIGGTIALDLPDDLIVRQVDLWLQTPAGERRQLEWARQNRNKLRGLLG